jgi:hypothetical protein
MEQSPSWEANSHSASQIPSLLWDAKFHYRVHTSPPLDPILSQRISPGPRRFETFRNNKKKLRWGVVSPMPNSQAWGPPLVGCPRLLIQYIRSYPPYLEDFPPSATWGRTMPWLSLYFVTKHHAMKVYWEWRYSSTHFLTSALDGSESSASRPWRFTPKERDPVPIG